MGMTCDLNPCTAGTDAGVVTGGAVVELTAALVDSPIVVEVGAPTDDGDGSLVARVLDEQPTIRTATRCAAMSRDRRPVGA